MANNIENLKPLSTEKAREIGAKGGKASVKARRKKKFLKEQLETLMLLDLPENKLKDDMRKLGIEETDLSIQNGMLVALVKQALNGSIRAFQVIRDQLEQNPLKGDNIEKLENIYFINDISAKLKETEKLEEK
jgi:hypothetical protein